MTRWFLDTEFNDNGRMIELISIGLVSEHGVTYYAESWAFDEAGCNDWVKANVLPKLKGPRKPRFTIAQEIRDLVLVGQDSLPEFYGYFSAYDWVALCQLYGPMVDRPQGFPAFCFDLRQKMDHLGLEENDLLIPRQFENFKHNALEDAAWIRSAWAFVEHHEKFSSPSMDE